jgi:transcriptional regulator with XRE-family HTH domain
VLVEEGSGMDREAVGKRIRHLRNARGWDQEALALNSGLANASSISKIEKAQSDAPLSTLLAIADALAVPPAQLFYEDAPETVRIASRVLHELYTQSHSLTEQLATLLPP